MERKGRQVSDYTDLFSNGWRILSNRQNWETRQRRWFMMRNEGLRRRNKPFPSAADLHLKLIDEKVGQKKAFTIAQTFGQPTLSSFVCLKPQTAALTMAAQQFHSFELKNRSNLVRTLQTAADTMWLRGRGIIKAYVDPFDDYRIVHENVDPLFLLMPDDVIGFDDAYEWIHVRSINAAKFKQDRRWCADYREGGELDGKTLKKCCGGKDAVDRLRGQPGQPGLELIAMDKEIREGYTHSNNSDTIIVWEHYVRTMGGVTVYSYCPIALDVKVRTPWGVPFKVNGRVSAPFFSFQSEVTSDEGWYGPRGVAEIIADVEIYGTKVWNAKADAITFVSTPLFESTSGIDNPANYKHAPGEVLPPGVKPVIFGAPPVDFDQEIAFSRGEAELRARTPDMGIEKPNGGSTEKRTAKEVSVAASISQIGMTDENITFQEDLSKLYAHDWGLMQQYKRKELTYFVSDNLEVLPEGALKNDYLIIAGGALDDWDRNQRVQKAQARYQLLAGKPNVNQDELVTELLNADDARLVKKLVIPQNVKTGTEAADENTIINDIAPGPNRPSFPVPVVPDQDHFTRARVILAWLDAAGKMGTPISAVEKQRVYQRLAQHAQFLKKLNPQQYKMLELQIKQLEKTPVKKLNQPLVPPLPGGRKPRTGFRRPVNAQAPNGNFTMM
jgi:hypothetical protein